MHVVVAAALFTNAYVLPRRKPAQIRAVVDKRYRKHIVGHRIVAGNYVSAVKLRDVALYKLLASLVAFGKFLRQ